MSRKAMGRWRCDMRRTGCLKSWFISCRAVALAAIFCLVFSNVKADAPEINANYLDTLTGAKVTWEEVASAGEDTIAIGDKFYKYTYHMPNGYIETNTKLNNDLTEENTTNKVFKVEYIGSGTVKGVAIYNSNIFQNPIIADFIENYAQSTSYKVYGGAVYNNGSMGDITGSFIGNYAYSKGNDTYGGAIYNYIGGTIGDITGEFIGNYAYSKKEDAEGGAVYNGAGRIIRNITGDFIGNYAFSEESAAYGGAINNTDGSIGDISGNFIGNYTLSLYGASGGAIYSFGGSINYGCDIGDINGNFENNYVVSLKSGAKGGAIDIAMTTIGDITGDFNGNYAYSENSSANGGAINNTGGSIGDITGNFNSNSSLGYLEVAGGAIYNGGTINNITGDFVDNYAGSMGKAFGGAIYNDWDSVLTLVNSSFYNNYAVSPKSGASGGAIFNEGELDIRADNGNSIFSGNYTEAINDDGNTTKKSNAIYSLSKINLNSINQGLIQFDDIITGGSELDKLVLKGRPQEHTSTESEYTFTYFQNEDGDYVITRGSDSIVAKNINNKYAAILYDSWSMSPLDLEYKISNFYAEEEGDYYIGEYTILEPILQEDGNYLVNFYEYYNTAGPALNITGDQSSDVVFNNLVEGFSTIDISGTKVHANKGPFSRSFTHNGGLLNVNTGVVAEDSIVGDGGRVN
ncbi:MAG: hypothetical protein E7018_06800, partial [Alphaproteobacteria bacterium]|nr:hypothetical protein [Alphaproteobacteria bacterium]